MAVMSSTYYLPSEELRYRNYPEINTVLTDVNSIISYAKRVNIALVNYNSGAYDKIDVDTVALQNYIDLCRSVNAILGNATNVCYDLLVEIRALQTEFQTIMYLKNKYNNKYVGTPTSTT